MERDRPGRWKLERQPLPPAPISLSPSRGSQVPSDLPATVCMLLGTHWTYPRPDHANILIIWFFCSANHWITRLQPDPKVQKIFSLLGIYDLGTELVTQKSDPLWQQLLVHEMSNTCWLCCWQSPARLRRRNNSGISPRALLLLRQGSSH